MLLFFVFSERSSRKAFFFVFLIWAREVCFLGINGFTTIRRLVLRSRGVRQMPQTQFDVAHGAVRFCRFSCSPYSNTTILEVHFFLCALGTRRWFSGIIAFTTARAWFLSSTFFFALALRAAFFDKSTFYYSQSTSFQCWMVAHPRKTGPKEAKWHPPPDA